MIAPAPANNASLQPLLDKKAAAAFLGCGLRTLDKMVSDGILTAIKFNWLVKFDPADLKAFVESRKRRPKAKRRKREAVGV
jgi:excisionase family DNA binding protein